MQTPSGTVETPALVPVATQAVVKALTAEQVRQTGTQVLIANTFHLHQKPGEWVVKKAGGLHKFMNWPKPLMTDSGGYQVFSLGFGRDFGTGKILKTKPKSEIELGQQPKLLKITEEGVWFRSFVDGKKLFLGPRKSVEIQQALGADIIFTFDECTPPAASYEYTKRSLEKTHYWAKSCLKIKRSKQALFGIVQGGKFKDLRIESARFIASLHFDGFGIGGEFGSNKKILKKMLSWVVEELPFKKPRHLLGIGHLEDIPEIIKAGVDLFDCAVPTHYARHGVAFTSAGRLDIKKSALKNQNTPLDKNCSCFVCASYTRAYLSHLFRAKEITALSLLTFHNLYYFNAHVAGIRKGIKDGKI